MLDTYNSFTCVNESTLNTVKSEIQNGEVLQCAFYDSQKRDCLQNDWQWEWLDKHVGEESVGDVFRKLEKKGCVFCVPRQKKVIAGKY